MNFVDIFSGIGGFRTGLQAVGARCVFSSELDPFAAQTYFANHFEMPSGDITKIPSSEIPNHDILCGGFPCQSFSLAGLQRGFDDARGTLIYEVARIVRDKQPQAIFLENVKGLTFHDERRTYRAIIRLFRDELGYYCYAKTLNARRLVPQNRERIFIVGFREPLDFHWPEIPDMKPKLRDILESSVDDKYTLGNHQWDFLQRHQENRSPGKKGGFGYAIADPDGVTAALLASYYKNPHDILLKQEGKNPRKLTQRECARLMGYPDSFMLPCSDSQSYKQLGNSVVPPLVAHIAGAIVSTLHSRPALPDHPFFAGNLHRSEFAWGEPAL